MATMSPRPSHTTCRCQIVATNVGTTIDAGTPRNRRMGFYYHHNPPRRGDGLPRTAQRTQFAAFDIELNH